ncbi:unnamed protein product [Didymodactylos carnosus]|uniref:Rab-GAP TBC domain-containing protein n=1 Tax=Didymodactylos carnosus TaxID=1234261 RepID=A0A8S2CUW1_9BILA|nr:unnamed protein product [Didymodactylos carnosus]CAF3563087.1 unnamed protein product [Didymodactylos carnosus]
MDDFKPLENDENSVSKSIMDPFDVEMNFNMLINNFDNDDDKNNSSKLENIDNNLLSQETNDDKDKYSNEKSVKVEYIQTIINEPKKNHSKKKQLLKKYARTRFGFINDLIRKQAWLYLMDSPDYCKLKLNTENNSQQYFTYDGTYYSAERKEIEMHRDYVQVRKDVERTLKRFLPNYSQNERLELQEILIDVIIKLLLKHDKLNYYQGYHDICLTFLLVLGEENCLPLIDTITDTHLTVFMEPTMDQTIELLYYLMPLVNAINSEVAEHIQRSNVGVMFAVGWIITWFTHVLDKLETVFRLYDLFVASHKLMPIYVAAEIINLKSDRILETECEMTCLHPLLTRLPSTLKDEEFELVIERALTLFDKIHPDTLGLLNDNWKKRCESIKSQPWLYDASNDDENKSYSTLRQRSAALTDEQVQNIPHFVLWSFTLSAGIAAIYIWNQTQRSNDLTQILDLGDLFSLLYGTR